MSQDTRPIQIKKLRSTQMIFIIGTGMVIVALVALIGVMILIMNNDENNKENITPETIPSATPLVIGEIDPSPSITQTITTPSTPDVSPSSFTPTYTFQPPTRLPATSTPSPTYTYTATPTSTATVTPSDTPTFAPIPSNTLLPVTDAPTVAFPNGRLVRLYYDEYSFYLWNAGQSQISVESLLFEALDSAGLFIGKSFEGTRWSQFYEFVEGGKCMAIETTQAPALLRPLQCRDYNAIVTPMRSSRLVFWITESGVSQFRVLWGDIEVGRCAVGAGECSIFLP